MKRCICTVLLALLLASCSRPAPVKVEDLQGTWVRTSGDSTAEWTFEIDGKYNEKISTSNEEQFSMEDSGKYEFEEGTIKITFETYGTFAEYKVSIDGDELTLRNEDETYTFKKKK